MKTDNLQPEKVASAEAKPDSPATHGSEVPTPRTDKWEYEQECNFDVSWEDNCRQLERELIRARAALQPIADLLNGDLESVGGGTLIAPSLKVQIIKDAKAALETHDAAGLPNADDSNGTTKAPKI